jgi:type I restriction enzyme R subunit
MPNTTGTGFVDYVLWGKNNLPLAVVEAKKASVDPIVGSQQAKLYADCLQNKYNQRPLIFTTNGFEFFFTNDLAGYPKREVSGFFTQDELQMEIDRRKDRIPLDKIDINDDITNRPYQKEAVTAVCDAITNKHRKMLIVQATGSGKTRVSISIVDVLRRHNYVKNILFLADRTALVKQAKNNYTTLLPDLSAAIFLIIKMILRIPE